MVKCFWPCELKWLFWASWLMPQMDWTFRHGIKPLGALNDRLDRAEEMTAAQIKYNTSTFITLHSSLSRLIVAFFHVAYFGRWHRSRRVNADEIKTDALTTKRSQMHIVWQRDHSPSITILYSLKSTHPTPALAFKMACTSWMTRHRDLKKGPEAILQWLYADTNTIPSSLWKIEKFWLRRLLQLDVNGLQDWPCCPLGPFHTRNCVDHPVNRMSAFMDPTRRYLPILRWCNTITSNSLCNYPSCFCKSQTFS